jgi:hypothetical protein
LEDILWTLINPFMTSYISKISLKTQNQTKFKKLLEVGSTLSGDEKTKEHLGETSLSSETY